MRCLGKCDEIPMGTVLEDYRKIYERFPVGHTWKKEERKERHKLLMKWQKEKYPQMPQIQEIIEFMKKNEELEYEKPFFVKVVVPCVYEDIEQGRIEAIRFLFESSKNVWSIGSTRDPVTIFMEASGWKYGDGQLADLVLEKEPDNVCVLEHKYVIMNRFLNFSIHEVPWGVLYGMNGAEKEQIPKLWKETEEYEKLCKKLGKLDEEQKSFIDLCQRLYTAWDKYLDDVDNYNGFQDYLEKHNINYG